MALAESDAYRVFDFELTNSTPAVRNSKVTRGQNHCFLVVAKVNGHIAVQCSGTKKFRFMLTPNGKWKIKTVKGTTPQEAEDYLTTFCNNLRKARLNPRGGGWGKGFSIRKTPATANSDRNFRTALKCGYFHQEFIDFCKTHGLYCHFKWA